jgi:hypothetical protein
MDNRQPVNPPLQLLRPELVIRGSTGGGDTVMMLNQVHKKCGR